MEENKRQEKRKEGSVPHDSRMYQPVIVSSSNLSLCGGVARLTAIIAMTDMINA
jgi:hypothetical protein